MNVYTLYIHLIITSDHGYVPLVVSTYRSFPHSWLITGFVIRVTRQVSLVVHVAQSLVFCVVFCYYYLSLYLFLLTILHCLDLVSPWVFSNFFKTTRPGCKMQKSFFYLNFKPLKSFLCVGGIRIFENTKKKNYIQIVCSTYGKKHTVLLLFGSAILWSSDHLYSCIKHYFSIFNGT